MEYTIVVAGDFNLQITNKKLKSLRDILKYYVAAESEFHRASGSAREIDFILSSKRIQKLSHPRFLDEISDHKPILCEILGTYVSIRRQYTPSSPLTDKVIRRLMEREFEDTQRAWK